MTGRDRLPNRRRNRTVGIVFGNCPYDVTIGTYPGARLGEIFVHGAKVGSTMDLLLDDIAVVLSIALQHGLDPKNLAASMGRFYNGEPASIVGALLDLLAREAGGGRG
jgi:hypothetical protein